jgi:hypothetical protein
MSESANVATNVASQIISGEVSLLSPPSPPGLSAKQHDPAATDAAILAYYYAALTNVFCQTYLFPTHYAQSTDTLRAIIDSSCRHFQALDHWLAAVDSIELHNSLYLRLFQDARDGWKPLVHDWAAVSRSSQASG